jgi:RNA-directed DNA polymerase
MVLDGLETGLKKAFPKISHRPFPLINLVRYADDFIITGRTQAQLQEEVLPWLINFLAQRGLELSLDKTKITHIDMGFNFLGQNVRKYKGKLLIKPSKESIRSLLKKVRDIIKAHKQATACELTSYLNPIIKGWANYHRHVVSSKVFSEIDKHIFQSLWKWCCRRHPNKGKRWIRRKYFTTIGDRNWVFYGYAKGRGSAQERHFLAYAAKVPIKRHIKVRAGFNPYATEWFSYSEARSKRQTNNPSSSLIQPVKPRSNKNVTKA